MILAQAIRTLMILKLEFDMVIKLDGSLIRNIDQDKKQRKIAQQLVSLCQILNAKTVAEFVHTNRCVESQRIWGSITFRVTTLVNLSVYSNRAS